MDILVRLVMGLVLVVALEAVFDRIPPLPEFVHAVLVLLVGFGAPTVFSYFFEIRRRRVSGFSPRRGTLG